MLSVSTARKVRVMLTPFRDGLQSSFGGKVQLKDILPAMEFASKRAGIRHFEFVGRARFQAPYFYVGEDPLYCQDVSRETDGRVNPLMPAMGPNVAGVLGTGVAAGAFLALLG